MSSSEIHIDTNSNTKIYIHTQPFMYSRKQLVLVEVFVHDHVAK